MIVTDRVYYLKNYHVIQTELGLLTCFRDLFDHQWMVENAITKERAETGQSKIIVGKPRQAGVTEYSTGVMCHCTFPVPNSYTVSVAQAPDVSAHIQRKVNIAYNGLPWWARPERQYHAKGEYMEFQRKSLGDRMTNPGLGSVFVTTHAQRSTGIAIGRTVRNLHMCLTAANQVIDAQGYHKSIANVQVGDIVRTPTGTARVSAVSQKPAEDVYVGASLGYQITPWCGGAFPIEGTGNHKVMAARLDPLWIHERRKWRAGETNENLVMFERGMTELSSLTSKHRLVYPVRPITEIPDYDPGMLNTIASTPRPQSGGIDSTWTPPAFDREFGYAIGIYIAEGCATQGRRDISLTLDSDEDNLAERFARAVGVGRASHPRKNSRTVAHYFHRAALATWFKRYIGSKDSKHIPAWAWSCGREFLLGIIEGMCLGDGHISPKYHLVQYVTTRAHLAVEFRDAIASLGFGWGSLNRVEAGERYGRNCQTRYDVILGRFSSEAMRTEYNWPTPAAVSVATRAAAHWRYAEDRSEVYVSIRKIERTAIDQVYDIEVDSPEHEFLLPCAWTHNSEVSRWASTEVYTTDLEPSMNAADTMAICESTGLGDSGLYYNMWLEAIEGESDWVPVFLPAYRARKFSLPLRPQQRPFLLTAEEEAIRERAASEEKFPVTDEFFNWRRRRIKSAIKRTGFDYAHKEAYPCRWEESFQSSGMLYLPRHKLDLQLQHCVHPKWVGEILFQGLNGAPKLIGEVHDPTIAPEPRKTTNRLWLWETPKSTERYYIGADTGAGIRDGDFQVAQVLRAGLGISPDVQVGEWVGWAAPREYAKILYALGFYFNRAEIAAEYAKEGMISCNYLANELEYPAIYRPRSEDRIGKQMASYLHWQTTSKSKSQMGGTMIEALLEDSVKIQSRYLMAEMFKLSKYGETYAGLGAHDDACIAQFIALFCLRQTMPELRSPSHSSDANQTMPIRGARPSGSPSPVIYGLYDQFFRLGPQTPDLAKAQEFLQQHPGWAIRPIIVSKVNTAYSIIHHGSGPESDLYRQQGLDSWDISPGMAGAWRGARSADQGQEAAEFGTALSGELWSGIE